MAEVNTNVQTNVAFEEEDFATMLEESFKKTEKDEYQDGTIIEIKIGRAHV